MPDIRYVRSGEASIAYHVYGDGPVDLLLVPDYFSNLVYDWDSPHWRGLYDRLAQSFRLILFDKRGTGLSDAAGLFPALETRMEDLRAVLDAVGSARPLVFGSHEGSSLAALYAATYPDRTLALALFQSAAVAETTPGTDEELRRFRDRWGTQEFADELLQLTCPTLYANPADREWFANAMRVGATPAMGYALNRAHMAMDLREVLPVIHVPTLVLYRGDLAESEARDTARLVRGSRLVRVPGEDYWGTFLSPEIPEELERLAAELEGQEAAEPETVLATVLFTDLVGSTSTAAKLGNDAWAELVGRHHSAVRRELGRYGGREVDTAGDGFFATFDGPARAISEAVAELGLHVRAGVHTGECRVVDDKPSGIAVNVGARVAALAQAGEVVVTSTVKDLVAGSDLGFEERGERELKGVPGTWRLYAVIDA
ncbi:MAG: hypothetical protein QOE36_1878 [Gaiellaceae bacterium]|nr:hypothetical protein [Gaiellaceae bacterium]